MSSNVLFGKARSRRRRRSALERLRDSRPDALAGLFLDHYEENLASLLTAACQQEYPKEVTVAVEVIDSDYDETGIELAFDVYEQTVDGNPLPLSDERPTGKIHYGLEELIQIGLHENDDAFNDALELELLEGEEAA